MDKDRQVTETKTTTHLLTLARTSRCRISPTDGHKQKYESFKGQPCDIKLTVNDQAIRVHQQLITDLSEYFKTRLSNKRQCSIDVSDVFNDTADLNVILDYMYTGRLILTNDNIENTIRMASLLQLDSLLKAAEAFLKINISPTTSMAIYSLSAKYNLYGAKGICVCILKAWLPFGLDVKYDLLTPETLLCLLRDGVLDTLTSDKRYAFLQTWQQQFLQKYQGEAKVPNQLQETIKKSVDLNSPTKQMVDVVEEAHQDVLISVHRAATPNKLHLQVNAFELGTKTWRLLVRHTFDDCDIVENEREPLFVGITSDGSTAYFLFPDEDNGDDCDLDEFLISIDIKTNKIRKIKIPRTVCLERHTEGSCPSYFLWQNELYIIFFENKTCRKLMLYRHIMDSKWKKVLVIPTRKKNELTSELFTVIHSGKLYIWRKFYDYPGAMDGLHNIAYFFHSVTKSGENYALKELTPVVNSFDYADDCIQDIPEDDDADDELEDGDVSIDEEDDDVTDDDDDEDVENRGEDDNGLNECISQKDFSNSLYKPADNEKVDYTRIVQIHWCPTSDKLRFIHLVDPIDIVNTNKGQGWQGTYQCEVQEYDIAKNTWMKLKETQIGLPSPDSWVLLRKSETPRFKTDYPMIYPYKLLAQVDEEDEEDYPEMCPDVLANPRIHRHAPEALVGPLIWMKTSTPYSTPVWQFNLETEQWEQLTSLPYSIDQHASCPIPRNHYFTLDKLPMSVLKNLPLHNPKDHTPEIQEGAMARQKWDLPDDLSMVYDAQPFSSERYAKLWSKAIANEP